MNDLALLGIITIYLLICTAFGFLRGLAKSRIRCITVAAAAVVALILTLVMKNNILSAPFIMQILDGAGMSSDAMEALRALLQSGAMSETIVGLVTALTMPMMFLLIFIILCFLSWMVHIVMTFILRRRLRECNENANFRVLQTVIMNVVQGIVVVFVVLVPFNVYTQLGSSVVEAIEQSALQEELPDLSAMADDYMDPISDSFVLGAFRVTGGELVCNALTDFEVNGQTARLNDEVKAFTSVTFQIASSMSEEDAEADQAVADLLKTLSDSMDDSQILSTVLSEIIYSATDAWSKDESFAGMKAPETGEMFDKLFDDMIVILRDDAKKIPSLQADLYTLGEVASVMADHDVLSKLTDDDELSNLVGSNSIVNKIITKLEANASMKALVPEIHNIGMRAIATYLDLDGEGAEEYNVLMGDIAGSLNSTSNLTKEERADALSEQMMVSFADSGVEVDKEVVDSYSAKFIDEFGDRDNVTSDEISEFLMTYAITNDIELPEVENN